MKTIHNSLLLVSFLLVLGCTLQAQNSFSIKGSVADSSGTALQGATVVLMQAADSVLVAFGISEPDGGFAIPKTGKGDYILQISYVGYQTYQRQIALDKELQLGLIRLEMENAVLKEVLVKNASFKSSTVYPRWDGGSPPRRL